MGICVALLLLFLSNNTLLFTPQNILSEETKFLQAQNMCCGSVVFICLHARCRNALCLPVLRRLRFLLKESHLLFSASQESLAFHKKSSLRSLFTRLIFDFRRCKIKIAARARAAFHAPLLHRSVKKQRAARRRCAGNLSRPATQNIHHRQTTASACHHKYIRNQLFMERSQELFNLLLLSN